MPEETTSGEEAQSRQQPPPPPARPMIAAMERGPGPAVYCLPQSVVYPAHSATKRRNAAWSIQGRSRHPHADNAGPGPGNFHPGHRTTHRGTSAPPAHSFAGRQQRILNHMLDTPGPNAYSASAGDGKLSNQRRAPNWTIGTRNGLKLGDSTPGPNSYTLPATIGNRVPDKQNAAAYSIHGRTKARDFSSDLGGTPGPAAYSVQENPAHRTQPRFTMSGRSSLRGSMARGAGNPSPADYSPLHKPGRGGFTMGIRHSEYIMPLILDQMD